MKPNIVIVGAGPAGISVAAEAAFHEFGQVLLLEKGPTHNQTVHQYYPDDKRVDAAYKGQEAICAGVLCFRDTTKTNFLAVADQMVTSTGVQVKYGVQVESIRRDGDGFSVTSTLGEVFQGRFVAIAIGRMGKPNRPEFFSQIPASVRAKVQFDIRGLQASGKRVLVVGGGNSAVEFALSLAKQTSVVLSYRKEAFTRLNPMNQALLDQDVVAQRITLKLKSDVTTIEDRDGVPYVRFREGGDAPFDQVIFAIGGSSPAAFLGNTQMKLDEKGNPVLNEWCETSVPGLYVVGELAVPPGKGSIISSFNTGKRAIEGMMRSLSAPRKSELVSLVGSR